MLDLAAEKYSLGDKVQEKQTLGCHLLASFMFACCSGYKVATTIFFTFFSNPGCYTPDLFGFR